MHQQERQTQISLAGAPLGKWTACYHTGFYFRQQNCPTLPNRVNSTSCVADRSHLLTVSDLASEQHSIWFLLLVLKRSRKYPDAHALELVSSACDLLGHGSSAYQRCTNGP